jgi:histidinol phosphatase-like PHP family hydrolase
MSDAVRHHTPLPPVSRLEKDLNGLAAALLHDMAFVQTARASSWGYKGAAAAVFQLDVPVESLVRPDGSLAKIPQVGPKSERVLLEVLRTGGSPTVERAVVESSKTGEVAARRALRDRFLSRAQVLRILGDTRLTGPAVTDYRGDLQMHSTYSDGRQSLHELAEGAIERGYSYCAITDHSHGLRVAGGISMDEAAAQHAEIDELNTRLRGRFRFIKGIEANIMKDGTLDLSLEERRRFELVLAAPHSALRSSDDQTARMIAAVRATGIHILGHPRGRMYGSRAGIQADWRAIFDAAADAGVAVEIDGDPARQDIDFALVPAALDAGCLFALDSDAHAVPELRYAENALAHARLAGIATDRVINSWPLDRLERWLHDRTS